MSKIELLKIMMICCLSIITSTSLGQVKFVYYDDFEIEYQRNPNLNTLSEKYNLLFLLLLDPKDKQTILDYDPTLKDLYEGYSYGLNFNETTVGFVTETENIEAVFRSESSLSRIFNCIFYEDASSQMNKKINYPIYIKDNSAVVEIFATDSSDIYHLRLRKGVIQINWLGDVNH